VSLPSSGETPSRPGARSSSGAQRGCAPAAAVSVLYCVTRHTPGTPSTLYTTTLPAAASLAFLCGLVLPFRAVAPGRRGPGGVPIASIAGPIGPGSANCPSCPFARVSSRCSYNTTSLHTHSVRSSPSRAAAARPRRTSTRSMDGVGVLGRAHARWARPPTDLTRALVPPAAPARTTPGRAEGRGRRGALGPSTCRAGPRRTIVTGWWCGWPVPRNRLSGGARHADTRVVDERASLRRTIL
jgi:hypothetical protein